MKNSFGLLMGDASAKREPGAYVAVLLVMVVA